MPTLQETIVETALSQVGVLEEGGNNLGTRIKIYQEATWLAPGAWPWCAAFTAWVLRESVRKTEKHRSVPLCKDPGAYKWEEHARKHGWVLLDENQPGHPGDFVTFDFSHIGVVVRDNGGIIHTVEGNTNGRGERDSDSGDGVWKKRRDRKLVKTFIRIPVS